MKCIISELFQWPNCCTTHFNLCITETERNLTELLSLPIPLPSTSHLPSTQRQKTARMQQASLPPHPQFYHLLHTFHQHKGKTCKKATNKLTTTSTEKQEGHPWCLLPQQVAAPTWGESAFQYTQGTGSNPHLWQQTFFSVHLGYW